MEPELRRAVLTLALGKQVYVEMAYNLARSFLWRHQESDIRFFLATDSEEPLPRELAKIQLIKLQRNQYGAGFSPKLHLDKLAPAEETLFLDADCICVANLEPVFDKFRACQVSVIGRRETEGELFGDIGGRCRAVGVTWAPRFCGGLYFLRKGDVCDEVFRQARELETRYDELGIIRLRGVPNEEPLVGLGMALAGQTPIPDDGSIKAEPMFFSGHTEMDVFAGRARLFNSPGLPKPYPEWQIPAEARPAVVHFCSSFAEYPPYTSEAFRLKQVMQKKWPLPLATLWAGLSLSLPFWVTLQIKARLRPAYHALFGPRAVKQSGRLPQ